MNEIDPELRTVDQNSMMWPILECFAKQLQWPVNGAMVYMSKEDWKDVMTAAFKQERVRLAMAWDSSGVVMLGQRTSKFGKKKMADFITFLLACAFDRNVVIPDFSTGT